MLRIVALNQEEQSEDEEEVTVISQEAQETIAESEYMRAIKLKARGKPELTLSLLLELLETKVLNEISNESKNEKLWAIRYNCYKNVAIIYEEKGEVEKALEHFVSAMKIDDTDVYTLNRFGRLALKNNALQLAETAFDKCLRRNPTHYGAADSILEILCRKQNILGAYGWALKLYRNNPKHEHAARVLKEIFTKFKDLIPFYEKIWGAAKEQFAENEWNEEKDSSVFPEPKELTLEDDSLKVEFPKDIDQFRIKSMDWQSFGRYIVNVYNHLDKTGQSMLFTWNFSEIISDSATEIEPAEQMDVNLMEDTTINENSNNSNSDTPEINTASATENGTVVVQDTKLDTELYSLSPKPSIFATPPLANEKEMNPGEKTPIHDANSDANDDSKSDSSDASKPKPRRRCSDLHFLEQWGWHKSRRYSSRKKTQPDRVEVDTTLNTYLRKIFAKFMSPTFENDWPFGSYIKNSDISEESDDEACSQKCKTNLSLEEFQAETSQNFDSFIGKLKAKPFDIMKLIYKWLKHISLSWQVCLPNEIKTLYLEIISLYLRHFDFSTWNQLNANNFIASYRMCLLHLELDYQQNVQNGSAFSFNWKNIFNQLMFKSGTAYVILNKHFDSYKLRLANLEQLWCNYGQQYEKCVTCLENMEKIINDQTEEYVLHLSNLGKECITRSLIIKMKTDLKRQIALKTVPKLYEEGKWTDLIDILKNNIMQSKDDYNCENWVKDMKVKIEILLQAFWEINDYEECLNWSDKFVHYCTKKINSNLHENKCSFSQKTWIESINYIFTYIEALVLNEGFDVVSYLDGNLSRLVQNIICLLSYQFDGPTDKSNGPTYNLDLKRLWVVLHQIILREENNSPVLIKNKVGDNDEEEEVIPNSFLVLFTAHEFMGKRQWCTNDNGAILQYTLDYVAPNLRAPLYDTCRDAVYEYIEQVTFCLYGYPQKKARSRHLEDHEASVIELTWPKAIQLFDLYRPENLPEFNSYKLESISADMEQLLVKILGLMPVELDPTTASAQVTEFISGSRVLPPEEANAFKLPYKISSIFYLLGDYHFKNRDFAKAIKYFTLDLACSPARFDAWAGMALSKASKVETKLNGLLPIDLASLTLECEETMRCFERSLSLDRGDVLIWIEYGSFAYILHAFCSRYLKQNVDKLSMEEFSSTEERKENMLKIAYNCFSFAAKLLNSESPDDDGESYDEKWLCQYMLGKIAEKRKEHPNVYLNYYLTAANFLYENNATYPIKLNHSNPTTLSIEALEMFYRTNSAIIKYLESHKEISREIGDLFNSVLRNLSNSPFAYNKAKIDGNSLNAFKRKIADKLEQSSSPKAAKNLNGEKSVPYTIASENNAASVLLSATTTTAVATTTTTSEIHTSQITSTDDIKSPNSSNEPTKVVTNAEVNKNVDSQSNVSPSRRESQESAATATTTTITSSTTSSTSSTDSSTSDSDSDSDETSTETESKKDKNSPYTMSELRNIYSIVVQNLEECITRFPEHYKSIYRLVYHYMNAPLELCDLNKCEQLLLGQYKTSLGNQISGLFVERKNNNLFNGIWRIPSSEIDRPGSFSSHLVKCVSLLEQMLMKLNKFKLLTDFGTQLYKTPDNDKRYIKDHDRLELYKQSVLLSGQIMRNILKNLMEKRDDEEILNFMLDIYKTHKKCIKLNNQKESIFIQCLIDTYKLFVQDKVENMPETVNFYDLAVKLCVQEIAGRKALEKTINTGGSLRPLGDVMLGINNEMATQSLLPPRPIQIPGLPMRVRPRMTSVNKQPTVNPIVTPQLSSLDKTTIPTSLPSIFGADMLNSSQVMSMMSMLGSTPIAQKDNVEFQKLVREFYKQILEGSNKYTTLSLNPNFPPQSAASNVPAFSFASSLPAETTITPSSVNIKSILDTKPTSTQNITVPSPNAKDLAQNMRLNLGLTDVTITPSRSMPKATPTEQTKPISSQSAATNVSNPNIYLQPIPNMLSSDIPKVINSQAQAQATQYSGSQNSSGTTKLQTKAKNAPKSKNITQKPFERASLIGLPDLSNPVTAIAELAKISPIIKTLSPENQAQVLSAYAELLKSTSLQNLQMLPQKRAAPKRKPKPQTQTMQQQIMSTAGASSSVSSLSTSSVSTFPTASAKGSLLKPPQQQHSLPILPTTSSFHMPTFDSSVMTISAIPKSSVSSVISATATIPSQSFSTGTSVATSTMTNFLPQQSNIQISPTKTLQQKLAERQKANQLNEAIANPTPQRKPSIDVIILD